MRTNDIIVTGFVRLFEADADNCVVQDGILSAIIVCEQGYSRTIQRKRGDFDDLQRKTGKNAVRNGQ